jgi:[ribosomal protein S18]-alanine N-acetyltransferase
MSAILRESHLLIRRMREADLDAVFVNEIAAYTHPWTRGILKDCVRVGYQCMLVELEGEIVGHAVLSAAAGEAHLLNLCVAPGWQQRGIGRLLLKRMLRVAGELEADTVFLEVRASNQAAQALYESEGFCQVGLRNGYYPHERHGREDAVVYAKPMG